MTLQQLRYFTTLGQHLHFGDAAKACLVSQPSLSQSITDLETELNMKLLDRSSRRVELTYAGKAFYNDAQKIIETIDKAILRAKRMDAGLEGEFRIGTHSGLLSESFLSKIASFKKKHETLDISLLQISMKSLNMALLHGSIEIALTRELDVIQHKGELSWTRLFQSRFGIVLRNDHPLAQCESIQFSELKDESFVFVDKEIAPNGYNKILQICASRGLTPRILQTTATMEIVCAMVKAGLGISILPDSALKYSTGDLKFIQLEGEDTYSNVVLVWRRRNMSPIVPLFLEEFGIEMP